MEDVAPIAGQLCNIVVGLELLEADGAAQLLGL